MTITTTIDGTQGKLDWTRPVLWLFAACLVRADRAAAVVACGL